MEKKWVYNFFCDDALPRLFSVKKIYTYYHAKVRKKWVYNFLYKIPKNRNFYQNKAKLQNREGFTYNQCRNQGYTKEFCGTNPWPGICRCPNGLVGRVLPGFMGECVCTLPAPQTYPPLEPPINRYYQNSYYF